MLPGEPHRTGQLDLLGTSTAELTKCFKSKLEESVVLIGSKDGHDPNLQCGQPVAQHSPWKYPPHLSSETHSGILGSFQVCGSFFGWFDLYVLPSYNLKLITEARLSNVVIEAQQHGFWITAAWHSPATKEHN